jgi:hypothetical protein
MTNEEKGRTITRTAERLERKITKAERERLKRVAGLPDDQIDTSDIPEITSESGWVRVLDIRSVRFIVCYRGPRSGFQSPT